MTSAFRPITKEDAAETLTVSKRTIENWIADNTMPPPVNIGRRVYWHPDVFYNWLNERLGVKPAAPSPSTPSRPRGRPRATLD